MEYLRIGTQYFRIVKKPTIDGHLHEQIIKWKRETIRDDHGNAFLKDIPKYKGFVTLPSHTNFQQEVNEFYNEYLPITGEIKQGDFKTIEKFLQHIFGNQFDLGLDYLTIIWRYPTQILPILCLVSEERKTGKTTFLNLLKLIFQGNMTFNKNEDFRSRFNSDWGNKLIIAAEEVLLNRKEDSERIKNLSTSRSNKLEVKGMEKLETDFFGKFILCSNNEDNFILIDDKEIRYWVIKIESLRIENPDILDEFEKELPAFKYFLNTREIMTPRKTRMWFTKDQIWTEALSNLVKGTRNSLEKDLILFLSEKFEEIGLDTLQFSLSDLLEDLKRFNNRATRSQISLIVNKKWNLQSYNSSYTLYKNIHDPHQNTWNQLSNSVKGRFYEFKKEFIDELKNC
ncbi:primase-helicase family protein [Planktosalinus lacus]|uniref:NrS-1 polymerase-like helicase domain-containing protein n=1 Tax=Planktosalinus lacus TaxID=1526573 RepID=A0A8J2VAV5_9FLAO|nr:primase-helicase family protein [Planktosalinus lacus]GGD98996.1 hypothetical protein GCM10011312_23090 [Planktosalinus lacus]